MFGEGMELASGYIVGLFTLWAFLHRADLFLEIFLLSMLVCVCVSRSVVSDSATPQTVAHQGPLSMGFSRQAY